MTPREMITIIQAYEQGKEIEWRLKRDSDWAVLPIVINLDRCEQFDFNNYDYRIKPQPNRWRAEKDGIYYFVDNDGIVRFTSDKYSKIDNRKYNIGNYFKTKEEAQVIANKFKDLFKEFICK